VGDVQYSIYLSTDNMWSANDFLLYSGTKKHLGGRR